MGADSADDSGRRDPSVPPPLPTRLPGPMIFCSACGRSIPESLGACPGCGTPVAARDLGQDPLVRMLLPVGRSGLAIAAGYLGLFSLIFFPAPLALLFGILAIRDIRRHPEKHGMGRAIFGVVMGALFTIPLVAGLVLWGSTALRP